MRAEFFDLSLFRVRGSEGKDFAAPFVQELHGQMTEAADADDTDAIGRFDAELEQGIENRRPGAEQRAGLGGIDSFRNRKRPNGLAAHALGEAAVTMND